MRTILAVPVVLALGCAHETQPVEQPPPPAPVEPPAPPQARVTPQARAAPAAPTPCEAAQVYFAFDSAKLSDDDRGKLDRLAQCLSQDQRRTVTVTGSADERGGEDYNKQLGERRAEAVARYLADKGVSEGQLTLFTNGEDSPICNLSAERCWQRNRRASLYPSCRM